MKLYCCPCFADDPAWLQIWGKIHRKSYLLFALSSYQFEPEKLDLSPALLDSGFLCEGLGSDVLRQSKGWDFMHVLECLVSVPPSANSG